VRTLLAAFLLALLLPSLPEKLEGQAGTVVFLVRHAERADDGEGAGRMAADPQMAMMLDDPPLSEAGQVRASLLAEMLLDAGITHVHSTDYRRTRETGAPTAEAVGVEVSLYDPNGLAAFAETLRATPGRHLVVGHSNTTPELVQALGGEPGPAIEPLEYDRLYVVVLEGSKVRTVLLRFGERFEG
jgi:broad specificity phosphatase PhoE